MSRKKSRQLYAPKKASAKSVKIPRQGAGTAVIIGGPNAGRASYWPPYQGKTEVALPVHDTSADAGDDAGMM